MDQKFQVGDFVRYNHCLTLSGKGHILRTYSVREAFIYSIQLSDGGVIDLWEGYITLIRSKADELEWTKEKAHEAIDNMIEEVRSECENEEDALYALEENLEDVIDEVDNNDCFCRSFAWAYDAHKVSLGDYTPGMPDYIFNTFMKELVAYADEKLGEILSGGGDQDPDQNEQDRIEELSEQIQRDLQELNTLLDGSGISVITKIIATPLNSLSSLRSRTSR